MSHAPSPATDDSDSFILSSTPTPAPLRSFSQWSATDHHQGSSYYTQPPSPNFSRARRATRSTSIGSSLATNRQRDDEILTEEDGDDEDHSRQRGKAPAVPPDHSGEGYEEDIDEDDPITTVKDRQSLINVQHPFGLPIWKPALYKKSRTVTRLADEALHSIPSAQAERHLLPGNLFWALAFGWWLGLICIVISFFLYLVPQGDQHYSNLVYGLGWYLAWPFGKYLEGDINEIEVKDNEEGSPPRLWLHPNDTGISQQPRQDDETELPKNPSLSQYPTITPETVLTRGQNISWASEPAREATPLLGHQVFPSPSKSYGTTVLPLSTSSSRTVDPEADDNGPPKGNLIGKVCFWLALVSIITPLMLFVCMICWFFVVTIPMAKLNWALIQYLFTRPTQIRFCAAPPVVIVSSADQQGGSRSGQEQGQNNDPPVAQFSVKHPRLSAGQAAPSGSPTSTVLLCTYRAIGFKFYKYTVGGVNILFVNLLPIVFFVIFDGFLLLPLVEEIMERNGHVPAFLGFIASKGLIFILCLTSVIPLSYFIGMAVASISAQSSIGMGAVINASFGSIIEIILYGMALIQGKGHLVEGSIVGSLLAGVLLMPGMSMCSGALRRKEQKFNAKSAGVTSMMLIMAIIGALTPTLFYQTYGNVWNSMSFYFMSLTFLLAVSTSMQWMSFIA
jgi:Ca2+:H+ antiporter